MGLPAIAEDILELVDNPYASYPSSDIFIESIIPEDGIRNVSLEALFTAQREIATILANKVDFSSMLFDLLPNIDSFTHTSEIIDVPLREDGWSILVESSLPRNPNKTVSVELSFQVKGKGNARFYIEKEIE